ncbi:replication factor A protein [Trifolium repens]|nr:replication factor A protein [Trifolium repens]
MQSFSANVKECRLDVRPNWNGGMAKTGKKFTALCDILPEKEGIHIKVRVLRLWKVPTFLNPSETGLTEMILLDIREVKFMLPSESNWYIHPITHLIEVASDETCDDVDVVPDSQP